MKTIEINIDASNMNEKELERAVDNAIKTAIFGKDNTNTKKIDKKDILQGRFLLRELERITRENYNLVDKIVDEKETAQELNEILYHFKTENYCFKHILKERKRKNK